MDLNLSRRKLLDLLERVASLTGALGRALLLPGSVH